jgi:hypothetical protein
MSAMSQPKASDGRFAPPEETSDLLSRVATAWTPGGADLDVEFLSACEADAKAHAGLVSVNRVRLMLAPLNIPPRRWSALWSHYCGTGKPMRRTGRWEPCAGAPNRNDGRPYPLRKWVG